MKDLFLQVIEYLPSYFNELFRVLLSPKIFSGDLILLQENRVRNALFFLGISISVVVIMEIPILRLTIDKWMTAIIFFIYCLLYVVLFSIIVGLSWFIVGGKENFLSQFVISCYYYGVMLLIMLPFVIFGLGILRIFEPLIYNDLYIDHITVPSEILFSNNSYVFSLICFAVGLVITFFWFFVSWGGYRHLYKLSKLKSAIAFSIFNILHLSSWIFITVIGMVYYG